MSIRILVYGWYGQGNLGDELFKDSFKNLFPDYHFIFTDHINDSHLHNIDAVFFGGGSFLTDSPKIKETALSLIKKLPIFYIGVGAETQINPTHQELMKLAKLIAIRSSVNLHNIKKINDHTIVIPDLVFSLDHRLSSKIEKSILVIPNILVVPKWSDPHWMHCSWDYFKNEFSQVLDEYFAQGYRISFMPMCINDQINDQNASIEIINRMSKRRDHFLLDKPRAIDDALKTISKYEIVITQRYHGFVLSQLARTHCLTIHHHDKLKNTGGNCLSYYGLSKSVLIDQINTIKSSNIVNVLPIDRDIFDNLVRVVRNLI